MDEDATAPATRSNLTRQPVDDGSPNASELQRVLSSWSTHHPLTGYDPIPDLTEIAELLERATEDWLRLNPDPQDDRHPSRTHPSAPFGFMLKCVVRKDEFMSKLVISYLLARDNIPLTEAAARILLSCIPALDYANTFSNPEELVPQLYRWALNGETPLLRAYSIGLLGRAMEVADNVGTHRLDNLKLIPVALQRLRELKEEMKKEGRAASAASDSNEPCNSTENGNSGDARPTSAQEEFQAEPSQFAASNEAEGVRVRKRSRANSFSNQPPSPQSPARKRKKRDVFELRPLSPPSPGQTESNSQWSIAQKVIIGTHKIFPLTHRMHQRLILQYLSMTGEYQDLVSKVYEGDALSLLLEYVDVDAIDDIRLTYDALKYLFSLLVHRKFALEFVARGGTQLLLKVPSSSLAGVGVSTCLYYLSYAEDVMEKVCHLGDEILDELMDYILWLIEHSHESGMGNATMFLSCALFFRPILERFHARDGLRKLYNYIATLTLLQEPPPESDMTEEQIQTSMQTVRNASVALRTYAAAHVSMRLDVLRRPLAVGSTGTPSKGAPIHRLPTALQAVPSHGKSMQLEELHLEQAVSALLSVQKLNSNWKAMEDLRRLGVLRILLYMLARAAEWVPQNNKYMLEMLKNGIDVIWMSAIIPRVASELCEVFLVTGHENLTGLRMLLSFATGKQSYADGETQIAALNACISCACAPMESDKKRLSTSRPWTNEILEQVWLTMRRANVCLKLNQLIRTTKTVAFADEMRYKACKLLCGLVRDPEIKQIFQKLPLIQDNELQQLMKEPASSDRKTEHAEFCHEAKLLISIVTDKSLKDVKRDLTQEKLWRSHVVSSTNISYNEKELLEMMHAHLESNGYSKAAAALAAEAELGTVSHTPKAAVPKSIGNLPSLNIMGPFRSSSANGRRESPSLPSASLKPVTPGSRRKSINVASFPRRLQLKPTPSRGKGDRGTRPPSSITLDGIVTEYFRVQHSNCPNPVSTCPPFSLYAPHRCPDRSTTRLAPSSVSERWLKRPLLNPHLGLHSRRLDEHFAFSRFRPCKTYQEADEAYTACAFSIDDEHLIVGLYSGEIRWINVETAADEATMQCHESGISSIIPSNDGSMLLTSSLYLNPLSTLWRLGDTQEPIMDFPDDAFVRFNNCGVQERILGTRNSKAVIFDINSMREDRVLENANTSGSSYLYNVATFSPDDSLVLCDQTLYDPRKADPIVHVFDRLNNVNGGIFHPRGNEIIINSEIWDVRTFRLLHSVPLLDQGNIHFNSTGNVMLVSQHGTNADPFHRQYANTLRTFSSIDYSLISTMDARKPIMDLAVDNGDSLVAVLEVVRYGEDDFMQPRSNETFCRTYEIGKVRDPDFEDAVADDDVADEEESSSSSSDSDDSDSDSSRSISSREAMEVMDYLSDLERGSDDSSDGEDDDGPQAREEESDGWETASNQEEGGEVEPNGDGEGEEDAEEVQGDGEDEDEDEDEEEDGDLYMDDGSDEDNDDDDPAYNPSMERQGSSSIVLNPHLRRRRQGDPRP